LEKSGQLYNRVTQVFNGVTQANSSPTLEKVQEIEAPKMAAHDDGIFLNTKLFERIATLYKQMNTPVVNGVNPLLLNSEQARLLDVYYKKFVQQGAKLGAADKEKLKKMNEEESTLENSFRSKLLGAAKDAAIHTADKNALRGLSDAELEAAAEAKAKQEAGEIQALIDTQKGGFKLQPWDWEFYSEQIRKQKYDYDDNQVKPYFEMWNVLENGVFYAANKMYGITYKERHDITVYNPDVRVWEVFDADGNPLALWMCDYYKRDNKGGGAWMDVFVPQSKLLG